MRLTRRDAVTALAAAGVAVGVGPLADPSKGSSDGPLTDRTVATLVAAAEVLYPDAVEGIGPFVERYAGGRAGDRPDHAAGIDDATAYLDAYADAWYDHPFGALDPATREETLRGVGADTADPDPDPDGTDAGRVRYYVVNELLYALYASPTGGELVGIENPRGYPGGTASYRRGPDR